MPYGVRGGSKAGVYQTWAEASAAATGVKGAQPNKFNTDAECRDFAFPRVASLNCPYVEKDEAKALGAKWDGKVWYVPPGVATAAFARWLTAPVGAAPPPPLAPTAVAGSWHASAVPGASTGASAAPGGGVQPGELALFTDGACKGNANVQQHACPAGWGVAVVADVPPGATVGGQVQCELYGPVELRADSPYFLGAEVGSNNTGELSGVCEALCFLIGQPAEDPSHAAPAVICYDSEYAAMQAQGKWKANKNKALVARTQELLRQARARRDVRFLHVKGHSGAHERPKRHVPHASGPNATCLPRACAPATTREPLCAASAGHQWNDVADRLAEQGSTGQRCHVGRFRSSAAPQPAAPPPSAAPPPALLPVAAHAEEPSAKRKAEVALATPPEEAKLLRTTAHETGAGSSAPLSLADKADALRRELGVKGTSPEVAAEAAEMLGIPTDGLGLRQLVDACHREVFGPSADA
jgi:ribonuclease HI